MTPNSFKILFITCNNYKDVSYGGGQCSNRNYNALLKYSDVDVYTIYKKSSFRSFVSILNGLFPPVQNKDILEIISLITINHYNAVFFDGSFFGQIARAIKLSFPKIKIVTFFHNIESDYVYVRLDNKTRKHIYYLLAKQSEILHVSYSEILITLTIRDSKKLFSRYGKTANHIIPITFEDKLKTNITNLGKECVEKPTCLIIGSLKRDTLEGVKWFVSKVSPHIQAKTLIVGRNYETKKNELSYPNVEVIGSVDDLSYYYLTSSFVCLPILSGAGMKVKTAEALMYGKTIFGTPEAFAGYEIDINEIGAICSSPEDFINRINVFCKTKPFRTFNKKSRESFLNKYSFHVSDFLFKILIERLK